MRALLNTSWAAWAVGSCVCTAVLSAGCGVASEGTEEGVSGSGGAAASSGSGGTAATGGTAGAGGSSGTGATGGAAGMGASGGAAGMGATGGAAGMGATGGAAGAGGSGCLANELCDNGLDDDCDGSVDEGCPCQPGAYQSCYADDPQFLGVGVCVAGSQTCEAGGSWGACENAVYPATESCNQADDDCDGQTDEGLTQVCTTACGTGIETCDGGQWVDCTAPQATVEVCDGSDNDCNGQVDDGLARACSTACGSGTETCSNGQWVNCTAAQPMAEVCDGSDNDCNGQVDDGLTQACSTACGSGSETCSNGQWVNCTAMQPTAEVCDGNDNDCNGQVDDGLTQGCSTACGSGSETCSNGQWVNCTAPQPAPEVCDGFDNNCNGSTDEGLTRACSTACGSGTESCNNGLWINCTAQQPVAETCDNVDNDCNGSVDENLVQGCGVCGLGSQLCNAGVWGTCAMPVPATTIALTGTVRDFNDTHPDFEWVIATDKNIVTTTLGSDRKPVYAHGNASTATVHNQTTFNQWYNTVAGVNMEAQLTITLGLIPNSSPPTYSYQNSSFFPIDNQLLGNQGRSHNYHFTYELHTKFQYKGGEQFTFNGDDDLWVYVNGRRVIDLGGVHGVQSATILLDNLAAQIGLTLCQVYDFDLFFAERHTTQSNFRIDTTIGLFAM